jgi:hypothetical protein
MAVGNIVGAEPIGPQAYNFLDKGGKKMTLFGPEAEELAQRLKASEELARGTQPTAKLDAGDLAEKATPLAQAFGGALGGIPGAVAGYLGGRAVQEAVTDVPTEVPGGEATRPDVPVGTEGPPASIARQPEGAGTAPSARFSDGKGGTIQQMPDGTWVNVKTTAPSRGGMMEKSRTVAGGFAPSEEYIGATEQAFQGQAEAQAKGAELAVNEAQIEQSYLAEQQRQNALAIKNQQDQQKAIQDGIRAKQAEYDMINERYKTQKVDPFRGMGTFQKVMLAVSSALGAFGASMARSPNFAQQMIDGFIERNVREQEREIAVKREQAQNTLADLEKRLGSMDLAKTALAAMMRERVQLGLQAQMAALKAPKAVAAFQDANAQLTQKYADMLEEYRQKAGGQVTRSIVNVPGSAGGTSVTPVSLDTAAQLKKLYGDGGQKRDPGAVKEERELAVAGENINFMEDRLKRYEEDDVPLMADNRWIGGRARVAMQDWLLGSGSSMRTMGEDDRALIQDYEAVKNAIQGAMAKAAGMGTAMSDSERAVVAQGLAPSATVGSLRRALAAAREINQRSQKVVKEFGPVPAQEIPTRPVE